MEQLQPALQHLPTEEHRATFRLLLAAVVARRHLGTADPSGWPSFVLVGPSKTAKTLLAVGACRVFGLDPARHVRSLPTESERSTWGRLVPRRGGGWELVPSAVLGRPLAVWDEYDKADRAVQRSILRMLQGEVLVGGEGDDLVTVRPTVVLTSNGHVASVPPEYLRRSVVLDTTPLVDALGDVHAAAGRFLAALPRLDLEGLAPEVARLPEDVEKAMLGALREGLSEDGWRNADERSLLHLALGATRFKADTGSNGGDLLGAVLSVVADYLVTARTVGGTRDPVPAALPDAEKRQAKAAQDEAAARGRRQRERRARLAVAELRSALQRRIDDAMPDERDYAGEELRRARALASHLAELREWVDGTDDPGELEEYGALVEETIGLLQTLPRVPESDRTATFLSVVSYRTRQAKVLKRLARRLEELYPDDEQAELVEQLRSLQGLSEKAADHDEVRRLVATAQPFAKKAVALVHEAEDEDGYEDVEGDGYDGYEDEEDEPLAVALKGKCPAGMEGLPVADALVALGALAQVGTLPLPLQGRPGWGGLLGKVVTASLAGNANRLFVDRSGRHHEELQLRGWASPATLSVVKAAMAAEDGQAGAVVEAISYPSRPAVVVDIRELRRQYAPYLSTPSGS